MNVLFIGKFGEKEAEKIIEESATIKCANNNTNSKGGNDVGATFTPAVRLSYSNNIVHCFSTIENPQS